MTKKTDLIQPDRGQDAIAHQAAEVIGRPEQLFRGHAAPALLVPHVAFHAVIPVRAAAVGREEARQAEPAGQVGDDLPFLLEAVLRHGELARVAFFRFQLARLADHLVARLGAARVEHGGERRDGGGLRRIGVFVEEQLGLLADLYRLRGAGGRAGRCPGGWLLQGDVIATLVGGRTGGQRESCEGEERTRSHWNSPGKRAMGAS